MPRRRQAQFDLTGLVMTKRSTDDSSAAFLSVILDRDSDETIMDQLHNQLRDLILSHRIPAGFKMPSTRRLCRELLVSRTVTLGAYEQLVFGGYLSSRAGSGHRVLSLAHIITSAADAGATQARDCAPCEAASPQMPFDPFSQATSIFPNQVWARLLWLAQIRPSGMPA